MQYISLIYAECADIVFSILSRTLMMNIKDY